jgi:DNA-binding transcriptional MerR regulator
MRTWTLREAASIAGLPFSTLNYWHRTGLLSPSLPAPRARCASGYTFRDLVAVRALVGLRRAGVSLQALRRVVSWIQEQGDAGCSAEALAGSVLLLAGDDVQVIRDGRGFSALRSPGQAVLTRCDVGAMAREIQERIDAAAA